MTPVEMTELDLLYRILLWSIPVIFAITLHEVAHGMCALYLGDNSARRVGRLTLNPVKHIDPVGSVIVPVILLWATGFIFGWAKPVPVNKNNFTYPERDMVLVAAAGPLANFIMSIMWAIIMKAGYSLSAIAPEAALVLLYMGAAGVFINTAVMMLNLLPLPPLDGGRILAGLLSERSSRMLSKVEPWGFVILVAMIIAGLAAKIVWPMMVVGMAVATHIAGIPVEQLTNALGVLLGVADF